MASYPTDRPAYFAARFVRLLTKAAAAQEIGPDAAWLLTIIVQQEDSKRYRAAVTFWNDQLLPLCGFGSRERLNNTRRRAVDAGWLHYEQGGKGRPGRYWVTIPPDYADVPDGPCDENKPVCRSDSERQTDGKNNIPFGNRTTNPPANQNAVRNHYRKPNGKPAPSIPSPKPGRNPDSDRMNETFENALPLAVRACKALAPKYPNDRQLIARAAVLAVSELSENWLSIALGGVTETETLNRCGKFHTCCRDHAERLHDASFDALARSVRVPRTFYARLEAALQPANELANPRRPPQRNRTPNTRIGLAI